jgi:hypothetical protein
MERTKKTQPKVSREMIQQFRDAVKAQLKVWDAQLGLECEIVSETDFNRTVSDAVSDAVLDVAAGKDWASVKKSKQAIQAVLLRVAQLKPTVK